MNDIDLIVSSVTAPLYVTLNQTIAVSWTVTNQGTDSVLANYWDDSVYISDDQFFDYSDTQLASRSAVEDTPLASGGSYTATQGISIPNYVATGDRYLLFVAGSIQSETNEDNNVFAQAITINAPDLVITAANAPTTATLGETISVSWTVKNQGLVSASSDWYDRVYISDDQFFDSSDTYLTDRYTGENTPLAAAGSYTATQDISIRGYGKIGDRYLLFVADGGNYQGETNEDNNVFAQAITTNAPDLVITAANAPTTAALGETISVSWTVKNQGLVSAFADWYDSVYISDDQFFDYSDSELTYRDTGENTPLAAAGSYTATQDISIPDYGKIGDRYLLFVADRGDYGYNYQGETNEDNNVFAQAITINAPDLVITAANAPITAGLGETISVSWTVKNQGLVSAFADWYDRVYISDDQFFDSSDTYLTDRYTGENTPLAAAGSYTATQDISIPDYGKIGDRYLLFVADKGDYGYGNYQGETNETNNVFAQAITINAPDLVITAANAPTTAALGETISVSWTVKNQGLVSAFADWNDAVYISDDQFFDSSDTYLTDRYTGENTPLAAAGSYTATQDISIPDYGYGKIGDRYLLFVADKGDYGYGNYQGETNETNNVFAQAITINAPDLVITAANAPTTATLGETISVSWTVKNQGLVSAFADWYDRVYISDDQFFDYSDTQLADRYTGENTPLAAAGSYTATQDISIPNTVAGGDRYLLFVADRGYYGDSNQGETNEDNNVFAQAITINAPDLVITAANAPTTATLGETISVSWTVKNQGTVSAFANWYDSVYISDDQFFDGGDTYLTQRYRGENTPLGAADSYTATQDISIPNTVAGGDRYLLFVTDRGDYGSNQSETNEDNNVFAQAITINAPDLVITAANAPTTATLGETISVSWTVKNQGTVSAFANWYDSVYISDDQFFDGGDTQLADRYTGENTPLAAAGSYTATQDISIFNTVAGGDRYLLFVADRGDYGSNQSETNEDNNVFAQAITINAPDLVITAANAPTTAALGETISVSWTVKNQGLVSAFAALGDSVYISDDQFFDYSDTLLAVSYRGENTPLAAAGSYTATQDISIPDYGKIGDRYLLFVADRGDYDYGSYQGETNEDNNVFAQAITINAPDLVITAANAPTTATLGETISVSWTVKNQGTVSAFANWYDSVYISDDQFFDGGDTQLADRYTGENTPLAAAGSYTATQDISIPNTVAGGDRYLLFVADIYNYQGETNEDNNIQAVAISLYAQDQIFNGTSSRDTLTGNDSNNLITGSQGADTLTGGAGSDRFVYTSIRDAGDTITDFVAGTDKIDLSQFLQSLSLENLDYTTATTQGYLSFGSVLSNTTVLIDLDGTAGRARPTPLLTVTGVSQSTLAQSDNFVF
ncbi:CARDB domain-containing protein [Nostoc sphaeroides]|uniref:Type I secretion C-terminal target domain-containing protein n=1 Tax=Nostoc sphaeroides CCNUC1 TaxID=2653204 RepID=A0A5P8WFS9_9NOSO|nr:CARDB domain-containing protein [Nostoc sphaeroides]QFS51026.1 type I secretion C-terminal target domain-containing protein [Nostoc sphaeroides CCNUC1]